MEKRKPHYDLETFKRVAGDVRTLHLASVATLSARSMGFEAADVAGLVRTMDRRMFYKSMTSYRDHTQWQDVYHIPTLDGRVIYLKFIRNLIAEFTILSFKER